MGLGWIFWLVIIGVVIWAIVRLTGQHSPNQGTHHNPVNSQDRPVDILKKRYARGEISEKEFKEMKKNL